MCVAEIFDHPLLRLRLRRSVGDASDAEELSQVGDAAGGGFGEVELTRCCTLMALDTAIAVPWPVQGLLPWLPGLPCSFRDMQS
jgi:hypothetical protein